MRDCLRAEGFYLYLEGELGPAEKREFEAHLAHCPSCRDALDERRVLHEAFASLAPLEVPDGFSQSVMDRIPGPPAGKAAWIAPLASGLAAMVVGLLGFYLLTGESLSNVLVAVSRSFSSGFAGLLPLFAKLWKVGGLLLDVASDFVSVLGQGLTVASGFLRPEVLAVLAGLGALLAFLIVFGARRLLSLGERS